jgi:hypothetical protein
VSQLLVEETRLPPSKSLERPQAVSCAVFAGGGSGATLHCLLEVILLVWPRLPTVSENNHCFNVCNQSCEDHLQAPFPPSFPFAHLMDKATANNGPLSS